MTRGSKRWRRRLAGIGAAGVAVAVSAAGGSASQAAPGVPTTAQARCEALFDGTVRRGPDAGEHLTGPMGLVARGPGVFSGYLAARANGRLHLVPVSVKVSGRTIAVAFTLHDGTRIQGMGRTATVTAGCPDTTTGTLRGQRPRDSGDWLVGAARSTCIAGAVHDGGTQNEIQVRIQSCIGVEAVYISMGAY